MWSCSHSQWCHQSYYSNDTNQLHICRALRHAFVRSYVHRVYGGGGSHRWYIQTSGDQESVIWHEYDDGDTMLMRAVGRGHVDVVRYLTALGIMRSDLHREVHIHTYITHYNVAHY